MDYFSFYDFKEKVNKQVEEFLAQDFVTETDVKELVGDHRAASKAWKCNDAVVIRKSDKGSFDYYGGGQYVDKSSVFEIGDYVFYEADDDRVAGWIGYFDEEEVDPIDDFNYVGSKHHY